ncbi:PLP-dependent aminotransferase family protein [Paraglaciecola sp.]|uniref:MocR-like pyridoxine biosynthesis transcription factor PdxR n=1 Tax=Paraglaciecola sp. TaxID=1920173 RepID=UPI003EF94506
MAIFNNQSLPTSSAKYLQLAEMIRQAIRNGQLLANDKLPSVKSIGQDMQINRHTVMKAFAELIAEGWIESKQRVGYKVVANLPIENSRAVGVSPTPQPLFDFNLVREGMSLSERRSEKFEYNFSGGQPDLSLFPFDEFRRHMANVLARPQVSQMSYGDSAGLPELIEQVKIYLRKSRAITNREVVITNGSQEALYIIAQLLLQPGDQVATENISYPPAISTFKNAGASIVGIKQDKLGLVPEDLADKITGGKIRLIYLTPLHQYPTTVTLPVSRRMKIYQLAYQYKIPIIEDDYDHEFHYRCQPLAPMASEDPQQLIIYMSTFSKVMFPGARVGILAISQSLAKAVIQYRLLICHKSNVLMQAALAKWMASGDFSRHLRRMTRNNLVRRDHAASILQNTSCFEFTLPDGGMALWVKLIPPNITASHLAEKAKDMNIYIQHETQYQLSPDNNQDRYLRIGYAGMNENKFAMGIEALVKIIQALHEETK